MIQWKKWLTRVTVILIFLTLLLTVFRVVMLVPSLRENPAFTVHAASFYTADRFWKIGFGVLIALGVLSFFIIRKIPEETADESLPKPEKAAYALCAAAFLVAFLLLFPRQAFVLIRERYRTVWDFWTLVDSALLLPGGLYFLFRALSRTEKKTAILSFCPALWSLLSLVLSYFTKDFTVLNPTRVLANLALCGATLFFLSEVRGYSGYPRTPLFRMLLFPAFSTTAVYGLSLLATVFLWFGKAPHIPFTEELILFPVSLLILTKLILAAFRKTNTEITEVL